MADLQERIASVGKASVTAIATICYGVRSNGALGYLKTFAEPSWVMIPLNLVEQITRTFSLIVQLFGNVTSGVFVVGIVLSLAGLLVPIPLMALDLLTGAVQAYIFAVLSTVFIAAMDAISRQPEASGTISRMFFVGLATIEAAREEAEARKKAILEDARKAAAAIARKSKADAAKAAEEGRKAQVGKATELAVVIARRLLANLPDDARVSGYPERLQPALTSLGAEEREALAADPEPLRLVAPGTLTKAELAAVTKAIRAAIPGATAPGVDLDETLIAGLELTSRHEVVHNSLDYDLGRIAEALEQNDQI